MKDFVAEVEAGLGSERLAKLRRDPDAYQQFWLGVLEARARLDGIRDSVPFLISNGYGAVSNMKRAERSYLRFRHCPECGAVVGYRTLECRECGVPTELEARHSEYTDRHARTVHDPLLRYDLEVFVSRLSGMEAYIGRRWLLERVDLFYSNHLKQLASETGLSAVRMSQVKKAVAAKARSWLNGERP